MRRRFFIVRDRSKFVPSWQNCPGTMQSRERSNSDSLKRGFCSKNRAFIGEADAKHCC
jgi:hypothetical protein